MAERCGQDSANWTRLGMQTLSGMFPQARVVYSGGQIMSDTKPGVIIWDSAGTTGTDKLVRINGGCPNNQNGGCKLGDNCFVLKSNQDAEPTLR